MRRVGGSRTIPRSLAAAVPLEEQRRNRFLEAANEEAVPAGTMQMVKLDDHELLIARVADQWYAADNRCPHMGGHLADGVLDGTVVNQVD